MGVAAGDVRCRDVTEVCEEFLRENSAHVLCCDHLLFDTAVDVDGDDHRISAHKSNILHLSVHSIKFHKKPFLGHVLHVATDRKSVV